MKLGEIVVTHVYYNFTKFHQNWMKNKKSFINSPFFCSEFQSASRIVKIVHSGLHYSKNIHFNLYTIQGIVTYLEKNEDIHDRGSTSNCFANSKRYWTQIHWWATCSMAEHFSSNSKFKQWITK